jgi:protein arginine kinase activator
MASEMRCENCGEREAEIQLTHIEGGEMATSHLCSECASEKGLSAAIPPEAAPLADFLAEIGEQGAEPALAGADEGCSYCGTRPQDFRKTGRLGCSHCYPHYAAQLRGLLRRVHGATQHVGKIYLGQTVEEGDVTARVATLRRRLERAVEIEDFEAAASLRDQIHDLTAVE